MRRASDDEIVNTNLREYFSTMNRKAIGGCNPPHHPVIAINTGNTLEHELKKCEIAFKLMLEGRVIITEGILKTGKRPDVVVLDLEEPIAYEIAKSEKESSLIKKSEAYPFRVIVVRA